MGDRTVLLGAGWNERGLCRGREDVCKWQDDAGSVAGGSECRE